MSELRSAASPSRSEPPDPSNGPSRDSGRRPWLKVALIVIAAYATVMVALAVYWCRQPAAMDVAELTRAQTAAAGGTQVPGSAFVATTIGVADTLLNKPGGFIHNDRLPPGVFLDDCPSWECGMIMALRDAVRALRNDFSRAQTQSAENLDLKRADLQFAIDPKFWIMPAAEDEYQKGIDALQRYLEALSTGQVRAGRFSIRADNLAAYLALVEKRLGNFGLRLSSSAGAPLLTTGSTSAADAASSRADGQPFAGFDQQMSEPPQHRTEPERVDDVFYCARGYSWAFLHFMQALKIDFAPVIADKNAEPTVNQIERDLQGATKPMRSPIVLNGHGYGFLANHSLVLASYIARVNAAVIDLRLLLQQG